MDLIKKILRSNRLTANLLNTYFLKKKYLRAKGWMESAYRLEAIDANGDAIPWLTYSAIDFLGKRMKSDMHVFEFGSGNSTIWLASRVARIVSIEYDQSYFNSVSEKLKDAKNVEYRFAELGVNYSDQIIEFKKEFNVVIIDGRERNDCAKKAVAALKNNGVIIFDNTDRDIYKEGCDFLLQHNFKRIDFVGLGPTFTFESMTSVFYKSDNCFEI